MFGLKNSRLNHLLAYNFKMVQFSCNIIIWQIKVDYIPHNLGPNKYPVRWTVYITFWCRSSLKGATRHRSLSGEIFITTIISGNPARFVLSIKSIPGRSVNPGFTWLIAFPRGIPDVLTTHSVSLVSCKTCSLKKFKFKSTLDGLTTYSWTPITWK